MLTSQWKTPCANTSCLEARRTGAYVEIRNSQNPAPRIWLPIAEWLYLVEAVQAGRIPPGVEGASCSTGDVTFVRVVEIPFTHDEWDTFTASVVSGDFDLAPSEIGADRG